jgi:hypothetical protein
VPQLRLFADRPEHLAHVRIIEPGSDLGRKALPTLEDKAAMLRFLADSAAASKDQSVPEPRTFSGVADACAEIERLVRTARRSPNVEALGVELKRDRA